MASKQIINDIDDAWAEYNGDDYMGTYFAFHAWDSFWKRKRWQHCCDVCSSLGGDNLRVVSYNAIWFTAGFVYETDLGAKNFYYFTVFDEDEIEVESAP